MKFASNRVAALVLVLMLVSHYVAVAIWWFSAEFPMDGLAAAWKSLPFLFIINILIYSSGQFLIWRHLVRSSLNCSRCEKKSGCNAGRL